MTLFFIFISRRPQYFVFRSFLVFSRQHEKMEINSNSSDQMFAVFVFFLFKVGLLTQNIVEVYIICVLLFRRTNIYKYMSV